MQLSYAIVDFYLSYDRESEMQYDPCRISDTQVTVKACGPLVSLNRQILQIGGDTPNDAD